MRYRLPDGMLPAIKLEIGTEADPYEPLFGLMTQVSLTAHGRHAVRPYATAGSPVWNTYSVIEANPGTLTLAGLLVSDEASIQALLAGFASANYSVDDPMYLSIIVPSTSTVLGAWNLYDYRLNSITLSSVNLGLLSSVQGSFSGTYRKAVAVVET